MDEQKKLLIEIMEADEKDGLYKQHKQQTAVEWLQEQLNPDMKTMQGHIIQDLLEQAKQMEKEQTEISDVGKDTADYIDRHIIESMKELAIEGFKPQTPEISDEEIEKAADKYVSEDEFNRLLECFEQGAKWYREQLKKK
jgi:hypothetical protein